jgi:hypothetical protein
MHDIRHCGSNGDVPAAEAHPEAILRRTESITEIAPGLNAAKGDDFLLLL